MLSSGRHLTNKHKLVKIYLVPSKNKKGDTEMSEQASHNNPNYIGHHPGAVQDVEKAHVMAKAMDTQETNSAAMRYVAEKLLSEAGNADIDQGYIHIDDIEERFGEFSAETGIPVEGFNEAIRVHRDSSDIDENGLIHVGAIVEQIEANNELSDAIAEQVGSGYTELQQTKR